MAGDLIPPPSPAGRPGRHGEGHADAAEAERTRQWGAPVEPERPEPPPGETALEAAEEEQPPPRLASDSPYRSRFGFLLGALIGVGIAAIVVATTLAVQSGGGGDKIRWSPWMPSASDGFAAVEQIAQHVGRKYRLSNGNQIVAVRSGPLEIANLKLNVALRTAPTGGDIELIDGKGVLYTLNGLGPRGSIRDGNPSTDRHLYMRREALELALYTFRYVDDVDLVVALLPPPKPDKGAVAGTTAAPATQALFYRPGDLEPQLDVPLQATMAPATPRPETMNDREAQTIEALTRPNLFQASFQQSQDAQAFLVLDRVPD
jgi:hypothetical protein